MEKNKQNNKTPDSQRRHIKVIDRNLSVNHSCYKSFYLEEKIKDKIPSFSGNYNKIVINSIKIFPNTNLKTNSINKKECNQKFINSKLNKEKIKSLPQKNENKRYFEKDNILQKGSKIKLDNEKNSKWNNLAFKEIKYEKKVDNSPNIINKKKYNILSNRYILQKNKIIKPLLHNYTVSNGISSINDFTKKKDYNNELFSNKDNKNINSNINRTINIDKDINIKNMNLSNEYYNKINKSNQNNDKENEYVNLTETNNNKRGNKNIKLNKDITNFKRINNNINKNKNNNQKEKNREKSIQVHNNKNLLPLNIKKKEIVKDSNTIAKFGRYYKKIFIDKKDNLKKTKEGYINKICKIQSIWKGIYLRKLMFYYWTCNKFKEFISSLIINHDNKRYSNYIKLFNNIKNILTKLNIYNNKKNNVFKYKINNKNNLNEISTILNKYYNFMKDYSNILDQNSELKKKKDEFEKVNKYNLNNKRNNIKKNFIINNNNFEIINDNKTITKLKEVDNENKNNYNNIFKNLCNNKRIKGIKLDQKENPLEKDLNNKNEINYNDYLNHFNSNLNLASNCRIFIGKNPKIKRNNEINQCKKSNYNFSLINKDIKKRIKLNEICYNGQINIINNIPNNTRSHQLLNDRNKYENESDNSCLFIDKNNSNNKDLDLIIKNNKDLLQKKKNIRYNEKIIKLKDNLIIKDKFENKNNNKISDYLKNLKPSNHYELKINDLNSKIDIINKNSNDDEFIELNGNKKNNFYLENNSLQFIKVKKTKKELYNEVNEVEKGDGIEINPYEMKRTKNNINNLFISYENKTQILNNKDTIFTEKAKYNMMKIIFPIKIQKVLKDWIRRNVFKLLLKNSK